MSARAAITSLLCCATAFVAGCSDSFDREVIVQLFRARGQVLSGLEIVAREGSKQGTVSLGDTSAFFQSCESNRVRIIPAAQQGTGSLVIEVKASGIAPLSRTVALPASEPLRIALGAGDLEPAGCAPAAPDGGVDGDMDGSPSEGGALATGSACMVGGQCAGGLCIDSIDVFGKITTLPGGYCTKNCDTESCDGQDQCFIAQDGNGKKVGAYCLAHCASQDACRMGEGYICTTNNACFPK